MTDRSNYQQVGVDVDEQSFAKLTQRANDAADSMGRLTQVNRSIADSAEQAGSRLQKAFSSVKSSIDDDINSIAAMRAQLNGAADDAGNLGKKVNDNGGNNGGGGQGGDSFTLAGARRSGAFLNRVGLGAIGEPLQFIGGLQSLEKTIDSIGSSVKVAVPAFSALDATLVGTAATLAPLVVLVGAVAVGVKLYNDSLEESSKALQKAQQALDTYYKAIQDGTTESIQKQLDGLQNTKKNIDAEAKNIQDSLDNAFKASKNAFGGDLGARLATGVASATNEDFRKLGDRLNELKKQSGDLDGQIQGLTTAMGSATVAANDAADAILKQANQTADFQVEQNKLLRNGTSKQIQEIIAENKDKVQSFTQELTTLQGIKNPTDDVKKRIAELYEQINQLSSASYNLTKNVLPLVSAREKEAQAEKDATKAAQEKLAADEKSEQAQVDAVKKLNDAIQSAEAQAAQSRLDAANKLSDALVAAAQKAADDANKALEQLEQKRADNLLSYQRDEAKAARESADKNLDDQIKAQRQERDDLQTHLDNLKQIRDRDAGRERDDLLNRNFRDLFALGEQKKQDVSKENDRYAEQQRQRNQALDDQGADEARAFAAQRRERLISYQQANQDALKQYEIEIHAAQQAKQKAIQAAQQGYQKELQLIVTATNQKEAIARQAAINEIKLITQTETEKLKIFRDALQQVSQLMGTASENFNDTLTQTTTRFGTGSSRVLPFAEGGNVTRGQLAKVNDGRRGQRESFNGTPFPPGLGLFIPAQSGYIDSGSRNNGPVTLAPVYQITGVDANQVVAIADARNRKLMKEVGLIPG